MTTNPYQSPVSDSVPSLPPDTRRPLPITILCIIGFAAFILAFRNYFTIVVPAAREISDAMAAYLVANFVLTVVSFVGYWRMAKWGVWLYAMLCAFGIGLGVLQTHRITAKEIVPAVVLAIGICYYRRMRW
jgi:hypothetical protein